jgi:hypothetical protein
MNQFHPIQNETFRRSPNYLCLFDRLVRAFQGIVFLSVYVRNHGLDCWPGSWKNAFGLDQQLRIEREGTSLCRQPASPIRAALAVSAGEMIAQQPIEFVGSFFREEDPGTRQLHRRLCSGDRRGEPVRPFDREVDVVCPPNDQCRSLQLAQSRLNHHRMFVVDLRSWNRQSQRSPPDSSRRRPL